MEKLKWLWVSFTNIFRNILWKIRNRGTGITVTYGTGWNPNFIGDRFMLMAIEFDKEGCTKEYIRECLPILDEAWDNLEKIVEPYEEESDRFDIATSIWTALEKAHRLLDVNPLKYTFGCVFEYMYKKARFTPAPKVLEMIAKGE